jgi:hypothetical protein
MLNLSEHSMVLQAEGFEMGLDGILGLDWQYYENCVRVNMT